MHHGGAERIYPEDDESLFPRGPDASPVFCEMCEDSCDKARSPAMTSGYLSSDSLTIVSPETKKRTKDIG